MRGGQGAHRGPQPVGTSAWSDHHHAALGSGQPAPDRLELGGGWKGRRRDGAEERCIAASLERLVVETGRNGGVRHRGERLAEGNFEVHRSGGPAEAGGDRAGVDGAQVAERGRARLGYGEALRLPDEAAEEPALRHRLGGAEPVELPGPVRGEGDQGNPRGPGLDQRREEVRARAARGDDDAGGPAGLEREPEGEEAGHPLVEHHPAADLRRRFRGGERERRAARARADDDVAHPTPLELLDDGPGPESVERGHGLSPPPRRRGA